MLQGPKSDLDRSLSGNERERERINIKLTEANVRRLKAQKEFNQGEIDRLVAMNEQLDFQIKENLETIEKSRRLVGGAKIAEVHPELAQQKKAD